MNRRERICLPEGADPELLRLFGVEPDDRSEGCARTDEVGEPEGER